MYDAPDSILLSRVAESAYWAGRYLERAEGTARLISAHSELMVDLPAHASTGWSALLAVLGVERDECALPGATEEAVVHHLIAESDNPSSVRSAIVAAQANLRVMRAVIPAEAAEVLTELHASVTATASLAVDRRNRRQWLTSVIRSCQTLSGIFNETMIHDDVFCFFTIGRQLERADLTTRVLDVQAELLMPEASGPLEPYLDICWFSALRSVSALHAFRRTGAPSSVDRMVAFLLRDPKCPRAVEACLIEASRRLLEVPGHERSMAATASAQQMLDDVDIQRLVNGGLHRFVDELQEAIGRVHDRIEASWFALATADVGA